MSIAPIIQAVEVKLPPARAFEIFAGHIGTWWPSGCTVGAQPHVDVIMEPRAGGRWFERDAQGTETPWGRVLTWDPPSRLLLAWQLDRDFKYDAGLVTEVELRFEPVAGGGTRVTLEHRDLERFGGADIPAHVAKLQNGWPSRLADFAGFADAQVDQA